MKKQSVYLFFLVIFAFSTPSNAMDGKPQEPITHAMTISDMPIEVLGLILSFIALENPNVIGNLTAIQQVCTSFKGILSDQAIQSILKLNQETLNNELKKAFHQNSSKKINLLRKLGAQYDPYIVNLLKKEKLEESENTVFERIKLLIENRYDLHSKTNYGDGQTATTGKLLLVMAVEQGWPNILTYLINEGFDPNDKEIIKGLQGQNKELFSLLDMVKDAKTAQVLLNAGVQLFLNCKRTPTKSLEMLVKNAQAKNDPAILIEVFMHHYSLQTATAIALALMAGASIVSAVCSIL